MKRLSYISFLIVALFGVTNVQAQQKLTLNNTLEPAKAQNEYHQFSLNEEAFSNSNSELTQGAEIIFHTEEGEQEFVITRKVEFIPGYVSIIAADPETGENTFAVTYHEGKLSGLYHPTHAKAQKISYDRELGKHLIKQKSFDADEILACGLDGQQTTAGLSSTFTKQKSSEKKPSASLNEGLEDPITIDVLMVYTDAAETWASTSDQGDINGVIAQALNLSQQALDNSGTNIELRAVHVHNTPYDETNDGVEDSDARLRRLIQDDENPVFDGDEYNGHMEEVHDLRDQYGADIVALLLEIDDVGGLAWRLGSTGGEPAFGFNLNRVQQVAEDYTLIHEIGHNMGNAHARTQQEAGATEAGGLFHYSAGYQDEDAGFHTVMAYNTTQNGNNLEEAPYFSSPDLEFEGHPTGTDDETTPENNALSMKQIKRTISYYRSTIEDAPTAEPSDNEIEVVMNREETTTIPVTITNSGDSPLVWDADFSFPGNTINKQKAFAKENLKQRTPALGEDLKFTPANYSGMLQRPKTAQNEEVIYSTSFETNEGFSTGTYAGHNEWRALSDTEFDILVSNANSGTQHLRFPYDDDGGSSVMASPFFGYQTLGTYEVTINFLVSHPVEETHSFYILDGKTGGLSSWILLQESSIYFAVRGEGGNSYSFCGSQNVISEDTYYETKIVFDPNNETVEYQFNDNSICQGEYLDGVSPGVIQIVNDNTNPESFIDVDDIEIRKVEAPYAWLNLPEMNGVIDAGESGEVQLNFTTEGVEPGEYETVFTIRTNESGNELIEIPVQLTVNDAVSNEEEDQPSDIALHQNYPNPFNPSTTITYRLKQAAMVQLEVFNMQGKKVATVQNQQRAAGEHSVSFDASTLSSGVYMYRLKTASQTITKQMVLIK